MTAPHSRVLVAHQPAYLPWCGYFSRMLDVSRFIILDHVQFSEGSYQNRNYIRGPAGQPLRLTVPVRHRHGQAIADVRIDDGQPWTRRHWRTLEQAYARAPYWNDCADRLRALYEQPWTRLADLNLAMIRLLANELGLDVALLRSSQIAPSGTRTGMLIDLCRRTGANVLRTGTGATRYLDQAALTSARIAVEIATYNCPPYPQGRGPFTPRLSVLDLILSTGPEAATILQAGAACRRWP